MTQKYLSEYYGYTWPLPGSGRRWTETELAELQKVLCERFGKYDGLQISDAIGSLLFDKVEMENQLQSAQDLAATHLADQELLVARERKRVARECAEICANIANGYGGHASWAADTIRDRYGVD